MAWSKTVPYNAIVSNENVQGNFYRMDGYTHCQVIIRVSGLDEEYVDLMVVDHLTSEEYNDLNSLLLKVRDAALTELGYTES